MGRTIEFLKKYNIPSINGAKFTSELHESNNSILFYGKDSVVGYGSKEVVGYSEHPLVEREDCIAVMFERPDGTQYWIHVPDF